MKDIKGFEGLYTIDECGNVFGIKSNKTRIAYRTKTSPYLTIDLWKEGYRCKRLIHRLVAEAFVPNPDNKPVVDHIDTNINNNHYTNLQWVTAQENVHRTYIKMSQYRNQIRCKLYYKNTLIGEFDNIKECCGYASDKYGLSFSMLYKHHKHQDYIIKV
jgi:hypothetical protein